MMPMKKLNHFILKIKNCGIVFIFCVLIVFGIILLYFIFKFKNNLEHRKENISPSMTLSHCY
jgi:predicted permease